MDTYRIAEDIALISELLGISRLDLAKEIGIEQNTLYRWERGDNIPSTKNLMTFYDYVFKKGIQLNEIKAQLHKELLESKGSTLLFHGSKNGINGSLSLESSRNENDFGKGFYCGESFTQAAMFVSGYESSSVYLYGMSLEGLRKREFHVDQDWMLAIAWYRGKIRDFIEHPRIAALLDSIRQVDYIVAPIADNRMFEILNQFGDGEITDVQCQHCLSATNLGNQYVITSQKALDRLELQEHCFLSRAEKQYYLDSRKKDTAMGADKVKIARRQFRGQGKYIDEVLA